MARGFYDHGTDDIWPSLRDLQLSTTKNTVVLMVRLPFSVLDFRCLRNTRNFWDSGTEKPSIRIVGILRSAETINRFFVVPDLELQNFCKQFQRPNAVSIPRVCWLKKKGTTRFEQLDGLQKEQFCEKNMLIRPTSLWKWKQSSSFFSHIARGNLLFISKELVVVHRHSREYGVIFFKKNPWAKNSNPPFYMD